MRSTLWILILCIVMGNKVMSQCAPSSFPALTCTGTPLSTNTTINSGDYYVGPGGGNFANISLNGGRLIICGNATLNNFNFNNGTLIINTGAVVKVNSQVNMGGSMKLYNYGDLTFGTHAYLGGMIYNHSGAVITVKGSTAHLNGGSFYNNGAMNFENVTVNSGTMCMGSGAQLNAKTVFNNQPNFITVSSGAACMSFETSLGGNNKITSNSNLRICQKTGASNPSSSITGSATVNANCVGCSSSLPLTLTSFAGSRKGDQAELNWTTSYEEQVKAFYIEQSTNGRDYTSVKEIPANNRPSAYRTLVALPKDSYFRLRMVDIDGTTTYSGIITVQQLTTNFELTVTSNPVRSANASVLISTQQSQQGTLMLVDNSGRMIRRTLVSAQKGDNRIAVDLTGVTNGQYFLYFQGNQDRSKTVPLIKM
ncbi:MAG: hypothetical protein J7578_06070 [Chitinophagaceae bacterium]|nr:hypothetical protein [Chitinophagaceae bacterium]